MNTTRIRVLELRSVRGTGGGPEKTIMLGAQQADTAEVAVTVCYIRDQRDEVFRLDERAKALGIDYVEVRERHSFDASILEQLRTILRDRRVDIVHAHDYKTNLLALLLARQGSVVPLSTVHGWTGHTWRERRIYYPLDRRFLARYPRLIAVSSQIADQLVESGAPRDRITVVLNAIDPDRFRRDPSLVASSRAHFGWLPQHRVVGAVGRLEPQKRFDLLIQAVARAQAHDGDIRLMIAGDGSQREILTRLASQALPEGACRILGHVDDIGKVHHAMDLFVQSSDYEGTPNAVLEAMAFESPIVATDAGGTAEVVHPGEHGLVIGTGSEAALTEAIREALTNRSATAARARAARRRVEGELSFRSRMRRVEDIYRELMNGTRPVQPTGILRWN
jgi:glycosyltransferase involved in cell wall biosynthesis